MPRRRVVPASYAVGTRRPVVILPGVYETWRFLRPIADELSRRGHPVHVMHSMGINRDAIPLTAQRVADEVAALDLRGVALVAHSKGGLIGKHLLAFDDPDGTVSVTASTAVRLADLAEVEVRDATGDRVLLTTELHAT